MPLISQVKIDQMLTNVSIQFKNPQYIAEDVAPVLPVKLETSKYFVYDKTRFDAPPSKRAERALYGRVEWSPTTDTYSCEEYGLEHLIDDRERTNAIEPLNIDVDSTEIVTDMVMNNRESRIAALIQTSGSYTHSNTASLSGLTTAWDQYATSDPINDITTTGRETIRGNTGMYPNVLILPARVFSVLKQHPIIMDRLKYNPTGGVAKGSLQALADLFEVEKILIGANLVKTSNENTATETFSDVWGKHVVLAYINSRPAIKTPSLCYVFQSRPRQVEKYRDDSRKSDVLRCTEVVDEKMVSDSCGYLWRSVIS